MNGSVHHSQELPEAGGLDLARSRPRRPSLPVIAGIDLAAVGPSVSGPLVTLALVIVLDLLARTGQVIGHPLPILLLSVAWAAMRGGVRPAVVSGVLTILYAAHFLSNRDAVLIYEPADALTLVLVIVAVVGLILIVHRLRDRLETIRRTAITREESERLERRLAFFAEAGSTLAATRDYELALRHLARIAVPTFGDWCLVYVADADGRLRCLAGAHREPTKDLIVRALTGFGDAPPVPGLVLEGTELLPVSPAVLSRFAADADQERLLAQLGARWIIAAPMRAGGRLAGALVFGTSARAGYDDADLVDAEQLAGRAVLAIESARLTHETEQAIERFRLLFEANPQPMWIFDAETLAFVDVNDAAVRHYGYTRDEFLGMSLMDLRAPDELATAPPVDQLDRRRVARSDIALTQHLKKDGSVIDVEIVSHELPLPGRRARLALVTDVSERTRTRAALREREEQLRHAQRMDAVGRLAGAIAHDFNNLLTTIQGFGDILLRELAPDDPHRHDLEAIRKAAERGALLTRQLLALGSRQALDPRPVDLNALVMSMEPLVQRLVGADVAVVTSLGAGIGKALVDRGQAEQILANLVLNARDAMPAGGTLRIETSERTVAGTGRGRHLRPGPYTVLAVSDTGAAPDDATGPDRPHGEPRLSSGVGLSLVHALVKQCGGFVRVASDPDRGSRVKVYLPQAPASEGEPAAVAPSDLKGHETVLVVDDEDGVRALLRKLLVQHGYDVLEARHGRDAVLAAQRHGRPIDLVVTDVVMPEMGGHELVGELAARYPGIRALYISGYTNDEVVRRGISAQQIAFIQKPFVPEQLVRRVRELLDERHAGVAAAPPA